MEPHWSHRFRAANGETDRQKLKLVPFDDVTEARLRNDGAFQSSRGGTMEAGVVAGRRATDMGLIGATSRTNW